MSQLCECRKTKPINLPELLQERTCNNLPMFLVDRGRYMHGFQNDQTYLKLKLVEQSEGVLKFSKTGKMYSLSLFLFF